MKNRLAIQLPILSIWTVIVTTTSSFVAFAETGLDAFPTQQYLKSPKCETGTKIYLVLDKAHESPTSLNVDENLNLRAQDPSGTIIYLAESRMYRQPVLAQTSNGLEQESIYWVGFATVAQANLIFASTGNAAAKKYLAHSASGFIEALWSQPSIWLKLKRPFSSNSVEKLAVEIDKYVGLVTNAKGLSQTQFDDARNFARSQFSDAVSNGGPEILSNLILIGSAWIAGAVAAVSSLGLPPFQNISMATIGDLYGAGRSIVFARNILESYCDAAGAQKPIFAFFGKGHELQVRDLIVRYLPSSAQVVAIDADKYEDLFKNSIAELQHNAVGAAIKDALKHDGVRAEFLSHNTASTYLYMSNPVAETSATKEKIRHLMQENGFETSGDVLIPAPSQNSIDAAGKLSKGRSDLLF